MLWIAAAECGFGGGPARWHSASLAEFVPEALPTQRCRILRRTEIARLFGARPCAAH
jgi:hypothetical protein